jgi:hypothetical protein
MDSETRFACCRELNGSAPTASMVTLIFFAHIGLHGSTLESQEGRMTALLACCNLLLWLLIPIGAQAQENPRTDYHEHLLSPAVARILGQPKPFLARDLIVEWTRLAFGAPSFSPWHINSGIPTDLR